MSGNGGAPDESFLPQIIGIFYAIFDDAAGPVVVHQIPDDLITTTHNDAAYNPGGSISLSSSTMMSPSTLVDYGWQGESSLGASMISVDEAERREHPGRERDPLSPSIAPLSPMDAGQTQSPISADGLFTRNFQPDSPAMGSSHFPLSEPSILNITTREPILQFPQISEYVIPRLALTDRLVTCTSGEHKILGYPCVVRDERYKRNEFRWNLCFVFGRRGQSRKWSESGGRRAKGDRRKGRSRRASAETWLGELGSSDSEEEEMSEKGGAEVDLSAFEGIVRKCGRILKGCEVESHFLSDQSSAEVIPRILEQLYEDLNNYSETSIRLDNSNYLELKLFPFFSNPAWVEDWHVPIALVDLVKIKDANWDITAARITQHINGINHVAKIGQLADADPKITRKCIQHFLFYQVVMMQDLFQYSNMYTVKPCIQTIVGERDVRSECGAYVTRDSFPQPAWPVLLDLYSRLLPGRTVLEWAEENDISALGIDPRRFISFGIIKGFLRRVHRWPIYERTITGQGIPKWGEAARRDVGSWEEEKARLGDNSRRKRTVVQMPPMATRDSEATIMTFAPSSGGGLSDSRKFGARGAANESSVTLRSSASNGSLGISPKDVFIKNPSSSVSPGSAGPWPRSHGQGSLALTSVNNIFNNPITGPNAQVGSGSRLFGPQITSSSQTTSGLQASSASTFTAHARSRGTRTSLRSGSAAPGFLSSTNKRFSGFDNYAFYDELAKMCNGDHHTDEIQCKFEMGWTKLEECLKALGEMGIDKGDKNARDQREQEKLKAGWGDFGEVVVILR